MADYLNQCRLAINEIFWHSFQSNIYLNICQSPSCVWIFTYLKSQQSATFPRGQWVTTLTPRQNGRNFVDDIFKSIFLSENIWIWIKISLKFVPKVPINNIPALFQKMAWRRPGDKPLSEPMMDWWPRSPTVFLPASGSRPFRRILPIISLTNLLEANKIAGFYQFLAKTSGYPGVYAKFSGRLSEKPFPWLIQKFPCILISKTVQLGCQLNLSEGQKRLDLTSGQPLV